MCTPNNRPVQSINEQHHEVQRLVNGFFRAYSVPQLQDYLSTVKATFLEQSIKEGIFDNTSITCHVLAVDSLFTTLLKIQQAQNSPLTLKS